MRFGYLADILLGHMDICRISDGRMTETDSGEGSTQREPIHQPRRGPALNAVKCEGTYLSL